jgi:hypothetical protein
MSLEQKVAKTLKLDRAFTGDGDGVAGRGGDGKEPIGVDREEEGLKWFFWVNLALQVD